MTLAFHATRVSCADAIDGEILQVKMDVADGNDEEERHTPCLLISQNSEFPGLPSIEWDDGNNYNGGGEIVSVTLRRDGVSIQLDRKRKIEVMFRILSAVESKCTSKDRIKVHHF
jgi:hypothetical protein